MNTIKFGTAIVGLLTPEAIYVGADSLGKDVRSGHAQQYQKIRSVKGTPYHFAVAGFTWEQNGIDLLFKAFALSFSPTVRGSIKERISKFEKLMYEHGEALLKEFPNGQLGESIKIKFKDQSINVLIFGAEHGKTRFWFYRLSFVYEGEDGLPVVTLKGQSESDENNFQWFFLGHVDKVREIIEFKQEQELSDKDPLLSIAYLLAKQTLHSPETVGSPYQIMVLANDGSMDCFDLTFDQIPLD